MIARLLVSIPVLVLAVPPGLCAEGLVESSSGEESYFAPYLSIAPVGSVLAAASADKISLFTIDPKTDPYITQAGELLLDSPHGRVESLVSAGDLLLVCHRAAISLIEVPSAETARVVGSITLRGPVKGVARIRSCLYVACLPSELAVIDIDTPQSRRIIVTVPTANRPTGIMAIETKVLVSLANGATETIDVSTPHRPTTIGFIAKVTPVVSPKPGVVWAWSNRPERPGAVLFSVENVERLAGLPIPVMGPPAAACAAGTRVYWADSDGKVAVIESSKALELVGYADLETPVAELVPCQGMLCALTRENQSLLLLDPSRWEPFSAQSTAEQIARRNPPLPASLRLRSPLARQPTAGSLDTLHVRIPSLPPPDQARAFQAQPPPTPAAPPADFGSQPARSVERPRSIQLDPFTAKTPPPVGFSSGFRRLEPRLRRLIIDGRGWVLGDYEGRTAVDSERR